MSQPDWQFRFDLFQLVLSQRGVSVTASGDEVLNRPDRSMIILIGDLERVPTALRLQLLGFVHRGGALLAASDRSASLPGLFTIRPGPVLVGDPQLQYEGFADCPRVTHLNARHPLMTGVGELIGNRCGWIDAFSSRLGHPVGIADLPQGARARQGDPAGKSLIAAVETRDARPGRMVVIADHSLLISGMLLHGDNALFAVNLINWLCEGRRRHALILLHGTPIQGGALQLDPDVFPPDLAGRMPNAGDIARLPRESLLEFANRFVSGLEDANLPNEMATGYFQALRKPYYFRLLYIVAALCGAVWLARQFFRRGAEPLRPVNRLSDSLSRQRVLSMINSDDYSIAARELARNLFRRLTGSDSVRDWPLAFHELSVDGSFGQKLSIARNLGRLRRLATGSGSHWLSRRRFLRLSRTIETLLALHTDGRLRVRTVNAEPRQPAGSADPA